MNAGRRSGRGVRDLTVDSGAVFAGCVLAGIVVTFLLVISGGSGLMPVFFNSEFIGT